MVKGISRRVVLVRSPDPDIFDEAIFIVREEARKRSGVTCEQLLSEARSVAENFVKDKVSPSRRRALPCWLWALFGAAATGAVWLLTAIF